MTERERATIGITAPGSNSCTIHTIENHDGTLATINSPAILHYLLSDNIVHVKQQAKEV
jgi:hypothetical protein